MAKSTRRRPTGPVDPESKFRLIDPAQAVVPPAPPSADVRSVSFDEMDSATLPQPVDAEGHDYEFSGTWDRWDIDPSTSTLISFSGNPSANSQPVPANVVTTFPVRASKIFYRLAPGASSGTLSIRVYRWRR
jgi:hypothetical protein